MAPVLLPRICSPWDQPEKDYSGRARPCPKFAYRRNLWRNGSLMNWKVSAIRLKLTQSAATTKQQPTVWPETGIRLNVELANERDSSKKQDAMSTCSHPTKRAANVA